MKPALIIVDMLKDTFELHPKSYIAQTAMKFVPKLNLLSASFRKKKFPVIYANDSFLEDDFIFQGKMPPHSIMNTSGADVIDQLDQEPEDIILPKRRFSSFFGTDLADRLKAIDVDTVVVTGIATQICVLSTVLDAVASDFKTILLKDCSAAHSQQIHDSIINIYSNTPLKPLLQVIEAKEAGELIFS